jgi:delta-1-pyrroline-5-carboxylate synthetase
MTYNTNTGLAASERRLILETVAKKISQQALVILSANQDDLNAINSAVDEERGMHAPKAVNHGPPAMQLTKRKLKALVAGIEAIALQASSAVGKNLRWLKVSDGLYLEQESVPMGLALGVFDDTCPAVVAEVAALCLASGNAVLLKPTERTGLKTVALLHSIFTGALEQHKVSTSACTLIHQREAFEDYLSLQGHVDIVIPRGGRELLDFVKTTTKIPVLGDAEGLCHVYVHADADLSMAANILLDSKCGTGHGQYALQTLLVHASLIEEGQLDDLIAPLLAKGVTVYCGPRMRAQFRSQALKMPAARSLNFEWGPLACAVEVVESLDDAMSHINVHGSHHTDVIVTSDDMNARLFGKGVESACVFHNCSLRFSDSYAFGLGQQVGVVTKRVGASRGPVGLEGLLTSKWLMKGKGHVTETLGDVRTSNWVLQKKCVTCGMDVSQ